MNSNSAVLLLTFNRPEETLRVLDRIKLFQPSRLYIVNDGPRTGSLEDIKNVRIVRDALDCQINWNCKIKKLYRTHNLGCSRSVSQGISWFFEHENEGVILEDDCLPDASFFKYCFELLARYRHDERIWSISGDNFHGNHQGYSNSYFFSRYFHCWGWAAWRRSWSFFPSNPNDLFRKVSSDGLPSDSVNRGIVAAYWKAISTMCARGMVDSWAYAYCLQSFINGGVHIHPRINLVSNIGFSETATHTHKRKTVPQCGCIRFPLVPPRNFEPDLKSDFLTEKLHFRITLFHVIKIQLRLLRYRLEKAKSGSSS